MREYSKFDSPSFSQLMFGYQEEGFTGDFVVKFTRTGLHLWPVPALVSETGSCTLAVHFPESELQLPPENMIFPYPFAPSDPSSASRISYFLLTASSIFSNLRRRPHPRHLERPRAIPSQGEVDRWPQFPKHHLCSRHGVSVEGLNLGFFELDLYDDRWPLERGYASRSIVGRTSAFYSRDFCRCSL